MLDLIVRCTLLIFRPGKRRVPRACESIIPIGSPDPEGRQTKEEDIKNKHVDRDWSQDYPIVDRQQYCHGKKA